MKMNILLLLSAALLLFASGCPSSGNEMPSDGDADQEDEVDVEAADGTYYEPKAVMSSSELPPIRTFQVKRGIVHNHSPYSHDACDEQPRMPDGSRNEPCFEDVRFGMCDTRQDFVFLSDHAAIFADYEYPEVLLYKEGDTLIMRNGEPVANRVDCGNGHSVIVAAGTETGMMPIGIEHHVGTTPAERHAAYGEVSAAAIARLHDAGAKVFLHHTEEWTIDQILSLPIDGIEMYNTHRNLMDNMGGALGMLLKLDAHPEEVPIVELAIIGLFQENTKDLQLWSQALTVKPLPAVMATDAHQNAFPNPSPDGERIDSFRRLMHWFSNHVLVPAGEVDDKILKEAIVRGRCYGAFEYLGYPVGFDFHAEQRSTIYEMGDFVPAAGGETTLVVKLPRVWRLDPNGGQPAFIVRLLRSNNGIWEEVATSGGDLSFSPISNGVYRAEVRINPEHLRPWLSSEAADEYLLDDGGSRKFFPWIYSNPLYVGVEY